MIMNSDSAWREQGCMPMKTHQSVSLRFEETHDQKPPPRERRLQLRIAGFVMRVVAFVGCEGLLWILLEGPASKVEFQFEAEFCQKPEKLLEAIVFCSFLFFRWMMRYNRYNEKRFKGLHFDSQGYVRPAASLRPAIPGIPASCQPASRRKWLWFGLDIGFSLRIGLVCHALVCSFFSAT